LVYEALHSVSVGFGADGYAVDTHIRFEEGVVVCLTRILIDEVAVAVGLEIGSTTRVAYQRFVKPLRALSELAGMGEHEFCLRSLRAPLGEREQLIRRWVNQAHPTAAVGRLLKSLKWP
jgi:hypothetical protein